MTKAKIAVVVFLLSIAITWVFWSVLPQSWRANESTDYLHFYEPVAQRLLAGEGITLPGGGLASRYPPGYPLALAGVFGLAKWLYLPDKTAIAVFILLCTGLSSTLIFLLGGDVYGLRLGLVGALLWMTYPFNLWLTKQPNSEIPFMVLFFAGVWLFWRFSTASQLHWIGILTAGLLAGLAALVRPIAIGLPLIFAGFLLFQPVWRRRIRWLGITVLLAGFLAVILPWEFWAYAGTGQVIPLSSGGGLSIWDGLTYAVEGDYAAGGRSPTGAHDLMLDLLDRAKESQTPGIGGLPAILARETTRNPLGALQLLALKAARSWYGTESGRLELANALIQAVYLLAIAWGGITLLQSGGTKRQYIIYIMVIVLYFWLMTVTVLSILRYMVPVMGLLITWIPAGIFRLAGGRASIPRTGYPNNDFGISG